MGYNSPLTGRQVDYLLEECGLEVYLASPVTFPGAQNIWYSPGAPNVQVTGDLQEGFSYINDSIRYDLPDPRDLNFTSFTTVKTEAGITVTLEFGLAAGSSQSEPDARSIQQTESIFSDEPQEISCGKTFPLVNLDELDFFIRQTSEAADTPITIAKGRWRVSPERTIKVT